ncbi:MAG: tRNA (adenosine(37)-N6)-threonylcarbamoyltransferase complex dimerization subunit type 1 TsaB [Bacteroidales bacterium]|nr:tRNA (adenosine(37)-N6)-threonylcarbamoyltransferase complex dimerization subunit type 1 TsaB [Bacteroidales bacterium]
MAHILHIETATQVCSVALSANGSLLQLRESSEKNSHSATVTLFIDEVMKSAGLAYKALDAVAISMGPGSYTGLRIGVSTAKGICYAIDKPLIAISTLQSMAAGALESMMKSNEQVPESVLLCPMIDARRMEVYTALYHPDLVPARDTRAEIIDESSFAEELKQHQVWFFGDGAAKCKPVLGNHPNARFIDDFQLSAANMIKLAEGKYASSAFEDVVYFEPYYLKDFIPGISKVKGLK